MEHLPSLEEDLAEDARFLCTRLLEEKGFEVRGDLIERANRYYRVYVEIERALRTLHISVIDVARDEDFAESERDTRSFGLIARLHMRAPTELAPLLDEIVEQISLHYRAAYISLEHAYVAAYKKWIVDLLGDLYTLINTQLAIDGQNHLCNRYWFSVTDLGEETFRYHFSVENLVSAISWLQNHQISVLSAVEAITLLLTQDVPDGILQTKNTPQITIIDGIARVMDFTHLPTLGGQTSFWAAEYSLFASKALAAISVVNIDGRAFEINFPADHVQEFNRLTTEIAEDLTLMVRERYAAFRRDQRRLRAAFAKLNEPTSNSLQQMGLDLAAKIIAEIAKP